MATAYRPDDLAFALAVIPSLPRPILSRLVARAIERLDEIDGDPDLERTGDEEEPDFTRRRRLRNSQRRRADPRGPGCCISDPKEDGGDSEADPAC
jgi:hypothetical protein